MKTVMLIAFVTVLLSGGCQAYESYNCYLCVANIGKGCKPAVTDLRTCATKTGQSCTKAVSNGEVVARGCAPNCVAGRKRDTENYCCTSNLCNSGNRPAVSLTTSLLTMLSLLIAYCNF